MRRLCIILLLALGACSKAEGPADRKDAPAPEAVDLSGVKAGPTLVPGIALTYGYDYLLPVAKVQPALESHASRCEALGPARCRITGLRYHAANRAISADLELKLAPADARAFGKEATATVTGAGGMLTDSEIASSEAGATAAQARGDKASVDNERADLERQLGRSNLPAVERAELQARIAGLRDAARASTTAAEAATALLASTPMRLSYHSGAVDPGFGDGPILGALKDGWSNIVAGMAIILMLIVTLLPWAIIAAVGFVAVKLGVGALRRFTDRRA